MADQIFALRRMTTYTCQKTGNDFCTTMCLQEVVETREAEILRLGQEAGKG